MWGTQPAGDVAGRGAAPRVTVHAEALYGDQEGRGNTARHQEDQHPGRRDQQLTTDQGIEMTTLGSLTLEDAAKLAAGNWQTFESFAWDRERALEDADNWAILYTHNRDSDLLGMSNAATIRKALNPYGEGDDPDVVFESHSHWAVGHVDGFSIRVYRDGEITDAFEAHHELTERMAVYPVLDEQDYSRLEHDTTLENITEAAWRLKREYDLPDAWESAVFSWFWEHRQRAVENRDDRGGYPEEGDLRDAIIALKYPRL